LPNKRRRRAKVLDSFESRDEPDENCSSGEKGVRDNVETEENEGENIFSKVTSVNYINV